MVISDCISAEAEEYDVELIKEIYLLLREAEANFQGSEEEELCISYTAESVRKTLLEAVALCKEIWVLNAELPSVG